MNRTRPGEEHPNVHCNRRFGNTMYERIDKDRREPGKLSFVERAFGQKNRILLTQILPLRSGIKKYTEKSRNSQIIEFVRIISCDRDFKRIGIVLIGDIDSPWTHSKKLLD